MWKKLFLSVMLTGSLSASAQGVFKLLPYGNMNSWFTREVKESFVIGGHTVKIYGIGPTNTRVGINEPYVNRISPWATSSVYAKVKGVVKGSVTVFPVRRGDGYAALLETKVENVKVFGLINIHALASGTIFLGQMVEPITGTDNPEANLISGIPFRGKPTALQFDYKVVTGGPSRRINGGAEGKAMGFNDRAEVQILLQKRWEDAKGNVYALRIGTGWEQFARTDTTWNNNHRILIHYGNITRESFYRNYMGMKNGKNAYYTRNSKGRMVPIHEQGWGAPWDAVTHMVLQFSSSNGGAFIGNPSSKFWIDNVGLIY